MEKTVYHGQFIEVREQVIDGYKWEKVYLPDSLVIFPLTSDGELIMINERRPHEKEPLRLKFVTGHIEKGEDPIIAANREMQEEIGQKALNIEEILIHHSSGTVNSNFYYFLATNLIPKKISNPDGEDSIVSIQKIKLEEIKRMLVSGELNWTLSTLGLIKVLGRYNLYN
jgi:ADP-ribose pyrophosphatase